MIEHIHGGREQHTLIGLTCAPGKDLGEEGFADARITDDDDARAVSDEVEIHKTKDAVLHLQAAFVMIELETVNGMADAQMSEAKPSFNGADIPGVEFPIDKRL